jgi:hypothetical protein
MPKGRKSFGPIASLKSCSQQVLAIEIYDMDGQSICARKKYAKLDHFIVV